MVAAYVCMLVVSISSVSFASDKADVTSFLQSLSQKKQETSVVKKNSQSKEKSFLDSVSQLQQKQVDEQAQLKQEEQQQEKQEEEGLHFIVDFYGNPKYQSAMKILNDSALQESYQQELNSMHMFFFEYAQKIISKHHTAHKDDEQQQTISSFLQTVKSQPTVLESQKSSKRSKAKKDSVNTVGSFLAHLKES